MEGKCGESGFISINGDDLLLSDSIIDSYIEEENCSHGYLKKNSSSQLSKKFNSNKRDSLKANFTASEKDLLNLIENEVEDEVGGHESHNKCKTRDDLLQIKQTILSMLSSTESFDAKSKLELNCEKLAQAIASVKPADLFYDNEHLEPLPNPASAIEAVKKLDNVDDSDVPRCLEIILIIREAVTFHSIQVQSHVDSIILFLLYHSNSDIILVSRKSLLAMTDVIEFFPSQITKVLSNVVATLLMKSLSNLASISRVACLVMCFLVSHLQNFQLVECLLMYIRESESNIASQAGYYLEACIAALDKCQMEQMLKFLIPILPGVLKKLSPTSEIIMKTIVRKCEDQMGCDLFQELLKIYLVKQDIFLVSSFGSKKQYAKAIAEKCTIDKSSITSFTTISSPESFGLPSNHMHVLEESMEENSKYSKEEFKEYDINEQQLSLLKVENIDPRTISIIKFLGSDGYRNIYLINIGDGLKKLHLAMEKMCKTYVVQAGDIEVFKREKKILNDLPRHINFKHIYSTFQDSNFIYSVTDICIIGGLNHVIKFYHRLARIESKKGCVPETFANECIASVIIAIEHLHRNNITHGDINPDNMWLTTSGHLKLKGLGKDPINGFRPTSMKYCAPEIIKGEQVSPSSDCWALGVVIFELLTGCTPFETFPDDEDETIESNIILYFHGKYQIPHFHELNQNNPEASDLISKLLTSNPKYRLQISDTKNGSIREHPWFQSVMWNDIISGKAMKYPLKLKEMKSPLEQTSAPISEFHGDNTCFEDF